MKNELTSLPRISIITPSFNQGIFIEETILSVLNQQYPNIEYIIIDGGSSDNTIDIIKKYEQNITFWISERDRGFGDAINKGIRKASGEVICWLNSDDLLMPNSLMLVGRFFNRFQEVDVVYGDRVVIDEFSKILYKKRYFFHYKNQLSYMTIPQESTFWRAELFSRVGLIDENLKFAIDLDLWCRFSKVTKIRHIPFFLGCFRIQPNAKSSTILNVGIHEKNKTIKKYFKRVPTKTEREIFILMRNTLRRIYKYFLIERIKRFYYSKVLLG